jgi:hypothetical protein
MKGREFIAPPIGGYGAGYALPTRRSNRDVACCGVESESYAVDGSSAGTRVPWIGFDIAKSVFRLTELMPLASWSSVAS